MYKFSDTGSETCSIPLKNPKGVRGEEEAGGIEKKPEARGSGEGAEGRDTKWAEKG